MVYVSIHAMVYTHGELREQATLSSLISPSTLVGSGDQTQAQFDHLSE